MKYGYARVSTEAQDLAGQVARLKEEGCARIFHEKRSGKNADRPELKKLLATLAPGDVVLATVTDRVARDPRDMLNIMEQISAAGAGLKLIDEPFLDTTSETAELVMYMLGWAAKWHRKRILENTERGRAQAKANGVKLGRKPKLTHHQRREALARLEAGKETQKEIARSYNVSHQTIGRLQR
jgi:DNA invertase Pin-like site-specific DNA recombinase